MNYSFDLHIGKESSRLVLLRDGEESVSREWSEARDMGRQLFEAIDDALAEVGLEPTDISDFTVDTDISDAFTSVKIARTVADAYRFGVSAVSGPGSAEGGVRKGSVS